MGQPSGGAQQNQGVAFHRRCVSARSGESRGKGGLLNRWPVQVGRHQEDPHLSLPTHKMGTTQNTSTQDPEVPTILKKKNKGGRHTLPDLKAYHKATVIRIVWYHRKDRHTDRRSRTESPEVKAHMCRAVFNDERMSMPFNGERPFFSAKGLGKLGIHMQKNEVVFTM